MTIQSTDNLIAAIGNGQTTRYDWNKITGASAYALGRWYDMSSLGGLPIANAWAGNCTHLEDFATNPLETVRRYSAFRTVATYLLAKAPA